MKKICVVTSTRAEYGLLKKLMSLILKDQDLELCLIATGTHLSSEFGYTVRQIEEDGFEIAEKIDILMSGDSPALISKTMGMAFISFADMYERQKPDMLIVLGDRYELIPICFAAVNAKIPIAHLSGGETTEGAVDECVRHCVTKMSYLHFPACEAYRKRIIQLGERPERVFNYGDVGVELVRDTKKLSREECSKILSYDFKEKYICVIFHPTTLQVEEAAWQADNLLAAIEAVPEYNYVFIRGNADAGGRIIHNKIEEFIKKYPKNKMFLSLKAELYLSVLDHASALLGNSSSGIVEAPAMGIPTINVGDRQKGRLQANSIINCNNETPSIIEALKRLGSQEYLDGIKAIRNPYGSGETSKKILACVKNELLYKTIDLQKQFYDLENMNE